MTREETAAGDGSTAFHPQSHTRPPELPAAACALWDGPCPLRSWSATIYPPPARLALLPRPGLGVANPT